MAIETDVTGAPHFNPEEFAQAIADHGADALHREAILCPCREPNTGQSDVSCTYCDNGVLWTAGAQIRVLIPGRQRNDLYDPIGLYMEGMAMMSFRSEVTPGHFDRIQLLNAEMVVNREHFVRGELAGGSGLSTERVRITPVLRVERLASWDDANRLIVEHAAADYDIDPDTGVITWNNDPGDGTRYSVRYVTRPSYIIMSPQSRDEGQTKQSYKALVQRLDFFKQVTV